MVTNKLWPPRVLIEMKKRGTNLLHHYKQAFDYGTKVAGTTVHFVDDGLDDGPIILQESFPIGPEDDVDSITENGKEIEKRLLPLAIDLYAKDRLKVEGRKVTILDG